MHDENQVSRKPNRLIHEKSPYLLQHAYNPVDWYPWGQESLVKAKVEDKPVFLSIGYSSCHWCHVMERECFEDEEVAKLLNEAFVCIKVDREERPDLDAAYMAVCQAMGRSCGWPLNVMLTPKLNAFFAASYIPKYSVGSMAGMVELIPQVMQIWKLRRRELEIVGADMRSRIEAMEKRTPETELGKEVLGEAYENLENDFDEENGGFGTAPKFPRPHNLLFLLRYWNRTGDNGALAIAEKTLRKMRLGGIFDQVGFGFHRYSTDAVWLVPHFEKMLYDQALLALAYTEAYQATHAGKFRLAAVETVEYVLRELSLPDGGFQSAQDADTEGEEGKFYLWTMKEIVEALAPSDADLAVHLFGVSAEGNYVEAATGKRNGQNILHLPTPLEDIAAYKGMTLNELIERLGSIQRALFELRKKRASPAKDDKVLTDWNGLMIAALAKMGVALNIPSYVNAASKAADFFLKKMRNEEGSVFHRYAKGERAIEGFLDDYAFLAFGLFELYEATFEDRYLREANALTKAMVTKFWDDKSGGFYFGQAYSEAGMPRMKQVYDGAVPSGNSVALLNLVRLGRLSIDMSYEDMARKLTKAFSQEIQGAPEGYTFLLSALDFLVGLSYTITLVGNLKESDTQEMLAAARREYMPNLIILLREPGLAGLGYEKIDGKATAYVCKDQMCLPPTNNVDVMLQQLRAK